MSFRERAGDTGVGWNRVVRTTVISRGNHWNYGFDARSRKLPCSVAKGKSYYRLA